ncbi:MAG: hypothetical protein ACR2PL_11060 [Dehalococcoidia bacterium]
MLIGWLLFVAVGGTVALRALAGQRPHTLATHGRLVVLKRAGSAGIRPEVMNLHHSWVGESFDAQYSTHWSVGLSYKGCPVTSRGTVRFTIYRRRLFSKKRTQYAWPVTDWKRSDSAGYNFPSSANMYFVYKVDILSPKGCQAWSLAVETN